MANYKEQSVSGVAWTRALRVIVENPYNGVPHVMILEERLMEADGKIIKTAEGPHVAASFDPAEEFEIRDPQTDEVIPNTTGTQADLHQMLYSFVRHKQLLRDVAFEENGDDHN